MQDAISLTAAYQIDALKLVAINNSGKAILADSTDVSQVGRVVGITLGSIKPGKSGFVQYCNTIYGFCGLVIGNYWVGQNGIIVPIAPTTGFIQRAGIAISADTFYIKLDEPVIEVVV